MAVREYCLCACFVAILIIVAIWFLLRSRYYQLGFRLPGPPGLPLLGNMLSIASHNQDFMEYVKELQLRYGAVCRCWIGPHLLVILSNPSDIAFVFNGSRTLSKPMLYRVFTVVFGNSLLSAEKTEWTKFRKNINPTFTHQIINSYVSTFYEKSRVMADRLKKHSDNGPFDVAEYTMMCTLDMVTETSLGMKADIQTDHTQHSFIKNLPIIAQLGSIVIFKPWFWFLRVLRLTKLYKVVTELVEPIRNFVDDLVAEKVDSYLQSRNKTPTQDENMLSNNISKRRVGFLEHMVLTMINNPGLFTGEELRDHTMFIMAAATDTTAYTVAYTLMLLGLHQDVQSKVLEEQEDIFGKDIHREVTTNDLKQMVYLEQVINETMRLYPIVPFVGRWVDEEVRIDGYTLPAGTTIFIPIYLVHRNPLYFPDPHNFNPDRFRDENRINRPLCAFIPFLSGRRMCLGKNYAYMAMKTMLSVVLRRYEVLEFGSRNEMEHVQFLTILKMVNGHNIKLRLRK